MCLKTIKTLVLTLTFLGLFMNCANDKKSPKAVSETPLKQHEIVKVKPENIETPEGMIWVEGKTFNQGAKQDDQFAMKREMPAHQVTVDGFFMDIHEVTNKQFKAFVDATGYVTVAEKPIDWEELKKDLPEGTPKPPDSILQPGCMTFNKDAKNVVSMDNYGQWWDWKIGANWKYPQGEGSSIEGKDDFPVVHIAYEDALAYCKWSNRRLPTEAEWEAAAQGSNTNNIYTWGDDPTQLNKMANTWQGVFPTQNESKDGFEYIAPIKSFPPNSIGLYDMLGNVWELTSDFYNEDYYKGLSEEVINPKGAIQAYNPNNPYVQEMIIKGGSYLCHDSYCASFRISAKMAMSPDSGADHIGFRTVASVRMLEQN
tara:strand:- start:118820 stop:119929 length:1110 start_codon:yes stop_codon:yes gene_type:complete